MVSLSLKQGQFVKEYLSDGNAARAVREVYGYDNDNACAAMGSRLLRNVKVQAKIRELAQSRGIDVSLVLDTLRKNLTEGAGVNAKASDSNRAAELLLRAAGMFDKNRAPVQQYNFFTQLNELPREAILKKRDEMRGWFGGILEGEAVGYTPRTQNQ